MNEKLRRTLGKAARDARRALGLTQEQVAEELDVSVEFYGRIERGVAWPSIELFARMRSALEVSGDSLLGADSRRAHEPAPLTPADDSAELRELMELVCRVRPGVLRLVSALVREIERAHAARSSEQRFDS